MNKQFKILVGIGAVWLILFFLVIFTKVAEIRVMLPAISFLFFLYLIWVTITVIKNNRTLPKSVKINRKIITQNQFIGAMLRYGDEKGYSYDGFSTGMTWLSIVNNTKRSDGRTEREVWLPLLKSYL